MPKIGNVYFTDPPEVEGGDWTTTFIGSVMSTQKDPMGPRKVLGLSKRGGTKENPVYHKAVAIKFSDGSVVEIADKTLMIKFKQPSEESHAPKDFSDPVPF